MSDQLNLFGEKTSPVIPARTSSAGSLAGISPSISPAGEIVMYGPDRVHANRFLLPEKDKEFLTTATSGPNSSGLSASAALQRSLVNKLVQRMDSFGSMEYALIWKVRVTPSGLRICALRASGRRISVNDYSGWPTPQVFDSTDATRSPEAQAQAQAGRAIPGRNGGAPKNLREVARLTTMVGWPTPTGQDNPQVRGERSAAEAEKRGTTLGGAARLATLPGWPTPKTPTGGAESGERKKELGRMESGGGDLQAVVMTAGWGTPASRDWKDGRASPQTMDKNSRPLNEQAVNLVSGWNTPRASDGTNGGPNHAGGALSADAALTLMPSGGGAISGPTTIWFGSDVEIVPCLDGKNRRFKSGSFPLSYGIPRDVGQMFPGLRGMVKAARGNRIGRLKCYGNAIVPALAAEFIKAFLEAEKELE